MLFNQTWQNNFMFHCFLCCNVLELVSCKPQFKTVILLVIFSHLFSVNNVFLESKPICWLRLYSLFASSTPWDSPISTWKLQTPETVSCFNGRVYIHRRYELDHFKRPIEEDVSSIPWIYLKTYKKLLINLIVLLEWIEYDSSSDSIWTCQKTLTFLMVIQWPW